RRHRRYVYCAQSGGSAGARRGVADHRRAPRHARRREANRLRDGGARTDDGDRDRASDGARSEGGVHALSRSAYGLRARRGEDAAGVWGECGNAGGKEHAVSKLSRETQELLARGREGEPLSAAHRGRLKRAVLAQVAAASVTTTTATAAAWSSFGAKV